MLSVIMAGGQGERLRPITCALPKPMAVIAGQPILTHCLNLLKKHGISKACVTLGYLPNAIKDEIDLLESSGVSLRFFTEKTPLGTAGGVKLCSEFLTETFAVLSGDGITDVDLTKAYEFHTSKNALATMVLTRVSNPTEYGLVETGEDGRVLSFLEKPDWKNVYGNLVNTGIYILEPEILSLIPDGESHDFGKQLFPSLVSQGFPVYGYETDAYWCDVGDIPAYIRANCDVLSGKVSTFPSDDKKTHRMPGAIVDERAYIESPVFIGRGARIMKNAFIGKGSVIMDGAVVMEGASVKRSIVYPNAVIGKNASIRASVLCAGSEAGENASIFEECVIGEKTVIGEGATIDPGVRIWPGKRISADRKISESIVWGQKPRSDFSGSAIVIKSPLDAVKAGCACAWKMNAETALVMRDSTSVSQNQSRAFESGLISEGVKVHDAGEGTLAHLRYSLTITNLDAGFYVTGDAVFPIEKASLTLSNDLKRRISSALSRQDAPLPYSGYTSRMDNAGRFDLVYLNHLKTAVKSPFRRHRACVFSRREPLLYLAENAFKGANYACRAEWEEELMELCDDEIGVFLSDDGTKASFSDPRGRLTEAENEMLITWLLFASGETNVYAPPGTTRALDEIAEKADGEIRYFSDESEYLSCLLRHSKYQYFVRTDGLYAALALMDALSSKGKDLSEIVSSFPGVSRVRLSRPLPDDKRASALSRLRKSIPQDYSCEEWFYKGKNGCAWLEPSEDKPVLSIVSEARDMETAREIADFFSHLISETESKA